MLKILFILLIFVFANAVNAEDLCFYSSDKQNIGFVKGRGNIPRGSNIKSRCIPDYRIKNAIRLKPDTLVSVYYDKYNLLNVSLLDEVPLEYKEKARGNALSAKMILSSVSSGGVLANPDEIELNGTVRKVQFSTSIGNFNLRWPRKIESIFGRTPERALIEAANTVSKTLKQSSFPPELKNLNLEWNVVFMDENMPEQQIPHNLLTNCHPGWMTAPANIYIVAQRAARGCSSNAKPASSVSDARLTEILLHEMGHSVEYRLMGRIGGSERMRSEGFATWFETYSSKYSALASYSKLLQENKTFAKQAIKESPDKFNFHGSVEDYARASMFFHVVVAKRGVSGLMDVYDLMKKDRLDIVSAIKQKMTWNDKKLSEEIDRLLNNN